VVLLTVDLGIGKTSFLRLLLDTSVVSSRTTKDQLASVAKFVQGSSGHTAHLRTASVDINYDLEGDGQYQTLGLSLIDTPSLDFKDEATAERFLSETIRHIDGRFAEGIEDVGAHFIGDCLLFSFFPLGLESTDRRPLRPFVSILSFCIPLILLELFTTGVSTFWTRTRSFRRRFRLHLPRSFPEPAPIAFPNPTMSPSF
jgi:hypothetical protein